MKIRYIKDCFVLSDGNNRRHRYVIMMVFRSYFLSVLSEIRYMEIHYIESFLQLHLHDFFSHPISLPVLTVNADRDRLRKKIQTCQKYPVSHPGSTPLPPSVSYPPGCHEMNSVLYIFSGNNTNQAVLRDCTERSYKGYIFYRLTVHMLQQNYFVLTHKVWIIFHATSIDIDIRISIIIIDIIKRLIVYCLEECFDSSSNTMVGRTLWVSTKWLQHSFMYHPHHIKKWLCWRTLHLGLEKWIIVIVHTFYFQPC